MYFICVTKHVCLSGVDRQIMLGSIGWIYVFQRCYLCRFKRFWKSYP